MSLNYLKNRGDLCLVECIIFYGSSQGLKIPVNNGTDKDALNLPYPLKLLDWQ